MPSSAVATPSRHHLQNRIIDDLWERMPDAPGIFIGDAFAAALIPLHLLVHLWLHLADQSRFFLKRVGTLFKQRYGLHLGTLREPLAGPVLCLAPTQVACHSNVAELPARVDPVDRPHSYFFARLDLARSR